MVKGFKPVVFLKGIELVLLEVGVDVTGKGKGIKIRILEGNRVVLRRLLDESRIEVSVMGNENVTTRKFKEG